MNLQKSEVQCANCDYIHEFKNRIGINTDGRSECPACRSFRYQRLEMTEDDVRATLEEINNVGSKVVDRLEEEYSLLALDEQSVDGLTEIKGIGEKTAQRILESV